MGKRFINILHDAMSFLKFILLNTLMNILSINRVNMRRPKSFGEKPKKHYQNRGEQGKNHMDRIIIGRNGWGHMITETVDCIGGQE